MCRLVVLSLIALSSACASARNESAPPAQIQTVRVVDGSGGVTQVATTVAHRPNLTTILAPLDQVWLVLPDVYETAGIPVAISNPTAHVIGNAGFKARGRLGGVPLTRYFDCGRTQDRPSAETYELHIAVQSQVQEAEAGRTTVSTSIQATARPLNFASGIVQCTSSGALEARIAELLKASVQG